MPGKPIKALTRGHYSSIVLQIKSLFCHYLVEQNEQKSRTMTVAGMGCEIPVRLHRHLQRVITEKV